MKNLFDNGFVDIDDIMPDSENNKIRELSEEKRFRLYYISLGWKSVICKCRRTSWQN